MSFWERALGALDPPLLLADSSTPERPPHAPRVTRPLVISLQIQNTGLLATPAGRPFVVNRTTASGWKGQTKTMTDVLTFINEALAFLGEVLTFLRLKVLPRLRRAMPKLRRWFLPLLMFSPLLTVLVMMLLMLAVLLAIITGLVALTWNRLRLHRLLHMRSLSPRGCVIASSTIVISLFIVEAAIR